MRLKPGLIAFPLLLIPCVTPRYVSRHKPSKSSLPNWDFSSPTEGTISFGNDAWISTRAVALDSAPGFAPTGDFSMDESFGNQAALLRGQMSAASSTESSGGKISRAISKLRDLLHR